MDIIRASLISILPDLEKPMIKTLESVEKALQQIESKVPLIKDEKVVESFKKEILRKIQKGKESLIFSLVKVCIIFI